MERALAKLRELEPPFELPQEIGRWLGVKTAELPRVLAALGCRPRGARWDVAKHP